VEVLTSKIKRSGHTSSLAFNLSGSASLFLDCNKPGIYCSFRYAEEEEEEEKQAESKIKQNLNLR
jgi:hypothetical protein